MSSQSNCTVADYESLQQPNKFILSESSQCYTHRPDSNGNISETTHLSQIEENKCEAVNGNDQKQFLNFELTRGICCGNTVKHNLNQFNC
jgi:hypothetical protein